MDEFEISSTINIGTKVKAVKWLNEGQARKIDIQQPLQIKYLYGLVELNPDGMIQKINSEGKTVITFR